MHLTVKVHDDVPSLRRPELRERLGVLLEGARKRGVRTLSFAIMPNHIHILCIANSAATLRDATRYVLGQLARFVNQLFRRRGKVFTDRYWSTCITTVKQGWTALCYVLKNAKVAGLRVLRGCLDAYSGVDEDLLGADRFLRSVLGPSARQRRAILLRMAQGPLDFTPLEERLQPRLRGL
jgi:REP element-mobilizing transposase RayT